MVSTTVARRALQLLAVAALACTASATASATINVKTPGITFAIIGGDRTVFACFFGHDAGHSLTAAAPFSHLFPHFLRYRLGANRWRGEMARMLGLAEMQSGQRRSRCCLEGIKMLHSHFCRNHSIKPCTESHHPRLIT